MDLKELKQYIDDVASNLAELPNANEEEAQTLLYESYANFLDLVADVKDILKQFKTI